MDIYLREICSASSFFGCSFQVKTMSFRLALKTTTYNFKLILTQLSSTMLILCSSAFIFLGMLVMWKGRWGIVQTNKDILHPIIQQIPGSDIYSNATSPLLPWRGRISVRKDNGKIPELWAAETPFGTWLHHHSQYYYMLVSSAETKTLNYTAFCG